jgi:tetratricopeptide (TPR) repeat protein
VRKKFLSILFFGILFQNQSFGQTDRETAIDLVDQAVELMDNGKIDKSLELLNQARELDPNYINVPYEIAFAYQLAQDYDKSIEVAKKLLKHPDVFDAVYQMIGNSYDLKGDIERAIKYYDKGLKKFPNSGKLYLEKGIVIAKQDKWLEALDVWEAGIVADPNHSSNYYYSTRLLSQTQEKIWAIYYGEIFLNLESNTGRSFEISKILFDTYELCLPVESKWGLDFSYKATNITLGSDFKFSFETVHNLSMEKGYKGVEPEFSIENLIKIRKQFLTDWNENYANRYPNMIFDYHNYLIRTKMFEPYFYWLLKDGSKDEFQKWEKNNTESYENFAAWFNENPMNITMDNKTNRFSYD